jgi:hypothetical protein
MPGFGAGMGTQNGAFKSLLSGQGSGLGAGPSFGDAGGEQKQDLGSVQGSSSPAGPSGPGGPRPPGGQPPPGGAGLGYMKLLGNLMKEYNPQQGQLG